MVSRPNLDLVKYCPLWVQALTDLLLGVPIHLKMRLLS